MSTQMRVEQQAEGWTVLNGTSPVAINGLVHRESRDELVEDIAARGLFVWADGTISKEPEASTPATEDPPTDPGADPEDPDPNPTVPQKPQKSETPAEEGLSLKGKAARVKKLDAEDATKKRTRKKVEKTPDESKFTEEQKKARAEYAKKYRASMTDEQKEKARAAARERQKRWRERNPDKATEFAKRSSAKRKERYNEDPNFRAEYRAKQKAYVAERKQTED